MTSLEDRVEALNDILQDFAATHAEQVADDFAPGGPALEETRRFGMQSVGDLLPVPPALLPKEAARQLRQRHLALRQALDHVFDGRLAGSWTRLAEALRLEPHTLPYVTGARRPRWLTVARPDVVLAGDMFGMVEPNAGSSCGMLADADVLGRIFERSPLIGDFLRQLGAERRDAVGVLADHLRGRLSEAGFGPRDLVAVVEFEADLDDYGGTFELLAHELRRHGIHACVAAVEELDADATGVRVKGERCGAVYRLAADEPDPVGNLPHLAPLLAAGRAGTVVVADELEDAIAANKTILATLSEELDAGRLPRPLAGALAGFVPWTRVLEEVTAEVDGRRVDLPRWCLAARAQLVLKPGAGYCGRGVVLGCEVDDRSWQDAVEAALRSPEAWLVQRTVLSRPARRSVVRPGGLLAERTFVDYGYFAVGDQVPAAVIRKEAPVGTPTRRVKLAGTGPVFLV